MAADLDMRSREIKNKKSAVHDGHKSTSDLLAKQKSNQHKVQLKAIEKKIQRDLMDAKNFTQMRKEHLDLMSNSEKYNLDQDLNNPRIRFAKNIKVESLSAFMKSD